MLHSVTIHVQAVNLNQLCSKIQYQNSDSLHHLLTNNCLLKLCL